MASIRTTETKLFRIPLSISLSDSTHGEISAFELVIFRVYDCDGAEGVGYTYTVGRNGGATAKILTREMPQLIEGREADDTEDIGIASGGACIMADAADRQCSRSPP